MNDSELSPQQWWTCVAERVKIVVSSLMGSHTVVRWWLTKQMRAQSSMLF